MRIALPVLLLLAAAPAVAQETTNRPSALETYRTRTVVVFGNDPCPAATSRDEIIVCARRPEEERYRLPSPQPEVGARAERGGAARLNGALDIDLAGGIGSCSTVGPGGATGCLEEQIRANRAEVERNRAVASPTTPESVRAPQ